MTTEAAARFQIAGRNEVLRVVDPAGPIGPDVAARLAALADDSQSTIWIERGYQGSIDPYVWLMTMLLALLGLGVGGLWASLPTGS